MTSHLNSYNRSKVDTVAKRYGIDPTQYKDKKTLIAAIEDCFPKYTKVEKFLRDEVIQDWTCFIASPKYVYGRYLVEFGEAAELTRDEIYALYRKHFGVPEHMTHDEALDWCCREYIPFAC